MTYPFGRLTPDQVRTTYFIAPPELAPLAIGVELAKQFESRRACLQKQGRDLHLVAWPDGSTVLYEQPDMGLAFDLDFLLHVYTLNAAMVKASGEDAA